MLLISRTISCFHEKKIVCRKKKNNNNKKPSIKHPFGAGRNAKRLAATGPGLAARWESAETGQGLGSATPGLPGTGWCQHPWVPFSCLHPAPGQPLPAPYSSGLGPPRGLWLRWQEPRWSHSPHLHPHHRPTSPSSPRGCVSPLREHPPGASTRPRLCHPRLGTAQPHPRPSSVVRQQSKHARKKKCDSKGDFSGRGGTVSAAFCFVFLR